MTLKWAVPQGGWPYPHLDACYSCACHPEEYIFGVPEYPSVGLEAVIIWAEDLAYHLKAALMKMETLQPECPFGHGKLKLTKVVEIDEGRTAIQAKCRECFFCFHEPRGDMPRALTERGELHRAAAQTPPQEAGPNRRSRENIIDRLKEMGYF